MAKLGIDIPPELEEKLRHLLPWGTKAGVVEELLWQLAERNDQGEVYTLLHRRRARNDEAVSQNVTRRG